MITVYNKFLPFTKRKKRLETKGKLIAITDSGDEAYYQTDFSEKGGGSFVDTQVRNNRYVDKEDEDDDDDDDDDIFSTHTDFEYDKPMVSLTGDDWKPKFNDRLTMFIAGTPGAGKSYLAKQMIDLLPKHLKILLFTALEENDGNFDSLGKERLYKIKMTPEVLSTITLQEIRRKSEDEQVILLFDDIDKIRDAKVSNMTFAIMNDALANGRGHERHNGKGDIHVLCTSHSANDYVKTKYSFENSNYIALFPGTTPPLQMYRIFDKMGLTKNLCLRMIKLARAQRIRSIIIHKVVPMYIIFGDKIMLL